MLARRRFLQLSATTTAAALAAPLLAPAMEVGGGHRRGRAGRDCGRRRLRRAGGGQRRPARGEPAGYRQRPCPWPSHGTSAFRCAAPSRRRCRRPCLPAPTGAVVAGPAPGRARAGSAVTRAAHEPACRQGHERARPLPCHDGDQRQPGRQPAAGADRRPGRAHRVPAPARGHGDPQRPHRAGDERVRDGRSARHHQSGRHGHQHGPLRRRRRAVPGFAPAAGRLADRQRHRRCLPAGRAWPALAGRRQDRQQRRRYPQRCRGAVAAQRRRAQVLAAYLQGATVDSASRDAVLAQVARAWPRR